MGVSLLSINGKLRSLYNVAVAKEKRSTGYKQVEIGEPLIVRYLYFYLKHKTYEKYNLRKTAPSASGGRLSYPGTVML